MAYRPIIHLSGVLTELSTNVESEVILQQFASPMVVDLLDGMLAVDTNTQDLVLRIGNFLYRFNRQQQMQSYVGGMNFNSVTFSHWIPIL